MKRHSILITAIALTVCLTAFALTNRVAFTADYTADHTVGFGTTKPAMTTIKKSGSTSATVDVPYAHGSLWIDGTAFDRGNYNDQKPVGAAFSYINGAQRLSLFYPSSTQSWIRSSMRSTWRAEQ